MVTFAWHNLAAGWPTKTDYYMQGLSVLCRRHKSAKVKGIVQRARSALCGTPIGGADHADGDLEARVAIAGQDVRNIAE